MTDPAETSLWFDLIENSPWSARICHRAEEPLGWRQAVMLMLHNVDPEPVLARLPGLVNEMYRLSTCQLEGRHGENGVAVTYADWWGSWRSHFDHWHDPVRSLVAAHCQSTDARRLEKMMPRMRGAVFCDLVLGAYVATDVRSTEWHGEACDERVPLSETDFEALSLVLYERFCGQTGLSTDPAPADFDHGIDFNRLFPGHPYSEPLS